MTTKAWLEGHHFDLETLATLLASGDVRVIEENEKYYLSSPQLENPPPGETFLALQESCSRWSTVSAS